jgi:DNA invertase Pin-like site-specific DNA recombinase
VAYRERERGGKGTMTAQTAAKCYSYIRFSTPEQLKGDSLRRQLELSEQYAKENGLILDDSLKMRDLGISAYKGEHRTKGALGRFQKLIEAGKIAKGSTLIVESLDRLSREEVFDALSRFMDIIRAGIRVVTLADKMEYTRESINANLGMQLMFSLLTIGRAHEESLQKSRRLSAAWSAKREKLNEQKLTKRCPKWLQLNDDRTGFTKIPARVRVIQRMFKLSQSGMGTGSIARILNKERVSWTPANGWSSAYVSKILRNRAVLGEFQPHTGTNGKNKRPHGEPVRGYFPAIVDENLFYSIQHGEHAGGRTGKISSLFGGLAKCGYCGGSMRFIDKGPKRSKYLVCDNAARGVKCERSLWRYDEIEDIVLSYCKGLKVADLLREDSGSASELQLLNDELAGTDGKLERLSKRQMNLLEQIADAEGKELRAVLQKKLSDVLDEQRALDETKKQLQSSISKAASAKQEVTGQIKDLRELVQFMAKETGEKRMDVRERLRNRLRALIADITFYPLGLSRGTSKPSQHKRMLSINLKTGSYRTVVPGVRALTVHEHEEGRTYYFDADGKVDVNVEGEEEEVMKSRRTKKRIQRKLNQN